MDEKQQDAGPALLGGAQLHQEKPNAGNDPIELKVNHTVHVTEHHWLESKCGACGADVKTDHPQAVQSYEKGITAKAHCDMCGQPFTVPGRVKIHKATRLPSPAERRQQLRSLRGPR